MLLHPSLPCHFNSHSVCVRVCPRYKDWGADSVSLKDVFHVYIKHLTFSYYFLHSC